MGLEKTGYFLIKVHKDWWSHRSR